MRTAVGVVVALVSLCPAIAGQTAPTSPTFEVASIRPSPPPDGRLRPRVSGAIQAGGRWRSQNATLADIIRSAYPGHALEQQLEGGPTWVRSTRFDILATAGGEATRDELNAMARALLADRFRLVLHTETRELDGYALVLARRDGTLGEGVRPPAFDCVRFRAARLRGEQVAPESVRGCATMMTNTGPQMQLIAGGLTLNGLANVLQSSVEAPIVDETGRTEEFDLRLNFASDVLGAAASDLPSIFTAIQEQLGLRLERRRVATEILVIDSVELPTEN